MGSALDTTGGIEGSSLSSINNKLIFVVVMETSGIVKKKKTDCHSYHASFSS
jgi:hypothetical protein